MDSAIVPSIYDPSLADIDLGVGTEESYLLTKRLALEEGLLVGISSGAALAASLRMANTITDGCHRDDLQRWRREVLVRTLLGGAAGRIVRRRSELTCRRAFTLAAGVADAIRAHGVETYPHECCGALVGRDGEVTVDRPIAEHHRRRSAPPLSGERRRLPCGSSARPSAAGAELLGFYHSHPDHPARPSQYDLDHACRISPTSSCR